MKKLSFLSSYFLLGLAGISTFASCAQELAGEEPPPDARLYYPTTLAATPDGSQVFINNANFDQRFNSGWITSVSVDALVQRLSETSKPGDVKETLVRQVRVPSLGSRMTVSADATQAFLAHRGSGLLTILDLQGGQVNCGDAAQTSGLSNVLKRTDCDRAHLVDLVKLSLDSANASNLNDFLDPHAVATLRDPRDGQALLAVGYLQSGWLSILSLADGVHLRRNINIGPGSLASLVPHPRRPGFLAGSSHRLDVDGSDQSTVYSIDVSTSLASNKDAVWREPIYPDAGGNETFGIAFAPDGERLYATNRGPDSVVVVKDFEQPITNPVTGGIPTITNVPQLQVMSASSIDRALPTDIVYVERPAGSLVITSSLNEDALYFFKPQGDVLQLVHKMVLSQGQGPIAMQYVQRSGKNLLFVATFFDHGLVVIDMTANSFADFSEAAWVRESEFGVATRFR